MYMHNRWWIICNLIVHDIFVMVVTCLKLKYLKFSTHNYILTLNVVNTGVAKWVCKVYVQHLL